MKISIIVPVYNIEEYIEECIKSLINQEFNDYEIILVDDGSTDASGKIIDKYAKYSNIKIVHKKNGGLSDARNAGIEASKGEYLMFIDGDDYLESKECLKLLSNEINKNSAEIIQYKKVYLFSNGKKKYESNIKKKYFQNKIEGLTELNRKGLVSVSACDKIVKAEIIKNNSLYFQKGLLCEDIFWSYNLYFYISSLSILNENIYVYRQGREGSISTLKNKKNCQDLYYIINYWKNYNFENNDLKKLYYNMISYWYLIYRTLYKKNCYSIDQINEFESMDSLFLLYHDNFKVLKAYKLSKIIGIKFTFKILKLYQKIKKIGWIRMKNG